MARNFFEIGRLGRSQPTAIDYSEGLQPALDDLKARLDESKLKRDTLLSQMPTGVAIEKVPEVFRGKVTEFLTQNRQQYIEASKVIASGLRPDDERYIGAMNTINSVKLRFDNLSTDLELYATTRKESLNQTNASLGVIGTLQNDHNNLASGEMTKTLAINEDGNITYVNDAGSVGLFKDDFKLNYQAETSFQTTVSDVRGQLRNLKTQKGATYDSIREDALNAFDTFFNTTTIDGIRHAMFSDQEFMEDYIKSQDPNFNFEDEEAVENKIRQLVETADTDELKKKFKEFYTKEGGYFETYFNEQPGYEEKVVPTEENVLVASMKEDVKNINSYIAETDIVNISAEKIKREYLPGGESNSWTGLGTSESPLQVVDYQDRPIEGTQIVLDGSMSKEDIRQAIYRAMRVPTTLQNRDTFEVEQIKTEVEPESDVVSLTIPKAPENKNADDFYRNIRFNNFGAKNNIPVAEYNYDTKEYDVRYGKRILKVPVSKLQSYFKLIGITDMNDVEDLANVLSGRSDFNEDRAYAKKMNVTSLEELKQVLTDSRGSSYSIKRTDTLKINAGGGRDAATLGYFVRALRNYNSMINTIKQQAGE